MEKITPMELRRLEFKKVFRGYEPKEVRLYIEKAADEIEYLLLENQQLKEKLSEYEKKENELKTAEEIVKNKIAEAEKEAEEIIKKATLKEEEIKKNLVELKKSKEEFFIRFKDLLINYLNILTQLEAEEHIE